MIRRRVVEHGVRMAHNGRDQVRRQAYYVLACGCTYDCPIERLPAPLALLECRCCEARERVAR